jgi:hypothetical protein
MANVHVHFMYEGEEIELQFVGLKDHEAEVLHSVIKKAANNGQNEHVRGYGWWCDNQGVMVTKGKK